MARLEVFASVVRIVEPEDAMEVGNGLLACRVMNHDLAGIPLDDGGLLGVGLARLPVGAQALCGSNRFCLSRIDGLDMDDLGNKSVEGRVINIDDD